MPRSHRQMPTIMHRIAPLVRRPARRRGALFCAELLFVLPIVVGLLIAMVEFGLVSMANQRVKAASAAACRVATLPSHSLEATQLAAEAAAVRALDSPALARAYELELVPGLLTGDPVVCEVRLPMTAAAPDALRFFGFSLQGRELSARTVMRKE